MRKILLTISYDGTRYCGWQKQKNGITVQQCLDEAVERLTGKPAETRGASRTDTGVHALGQRAVFETDMNIPTEKIPFALNSMLPDDIVITDSIEVSEDFHPQYNVIKKTYEYSIYNSVFANPLVSRYSAFVHRKLDFEKMKEVCKYFIGEYDFKAFCASGSTAKTTVREIYDMTAVKNGDMIKISVTGNGFLYNMVRIIAGTCIDVGLGKIQPNEIRGIILGGDRKKAGQTAPPQGLVLKEIFYCMNEYEKGEK